MSSSALPATPGHPSEPPRLRRRPPTLPSLEGRRPKRSALPIRSSKLVAALAGGLVLALVASGCDGGGGRTTKASAPEPSPSAAASSSPGATPSASPTGVPTNGPSASSSRLSCSTGVPAQGPGAIVASVGDVSARLSWTHQGDPGAGYMTGARIKLTRAGVTLLDTAAAAPSPVNQPSDGWQKGWEVLGPVCVEVPTSDLPSVHLRGYALAMTCCNASRTYYPRPDGTYATADRNLGRGDGTFELAGGRVVLVASNPDFNVKFDCGACSPGALQAWELHDGRFADVTRQFPDRIAAEAEGWWRTIEPADPTPLGLLAPWVADECELGWQASAYATLDRLNAAGKLRGTSEGSPSTFPTGSPFVTALKSFLTTEGYCH